MKQIFSFLILASLLLLGSYSQAVNLKGYVYLEKNRYVFIPSDTTTAHPIVTSNSEVKEALTKLKSFDSLVGSGEFLKDGKLRLDSIDFVALRRLLGKWKSRLATVNFVDYTHVSFELFNSQANYKYVITPGLGDAWKIFFTDNSSVVLGAVAVEEQFAEIELYDSQTGDVTQRLRLQKVK